MNVDTILAHPNIIQLESFISEPSTSSVALTEPLSLIWNEEK